MESCLLPLMHHFHSRKAQIPNSFITMIWHKHDIITKCTNAQTRSQARTLFCGARSSILCIKKTLQPEQVDFPTPLWLVPNLPEALLCFLIDKDDGGVNLLQKLRSCLDKKWLSCYHLLLPYLCDL